MEKFSDLSESILFINKGISIAKEKKSVWEDDNKVIQLFSMAYKLYYSQIHEYLYSISSKKSEEQTRKLCNDIKMFILPLAKEKADGVKSKFNAKRKALKRRYDGDELEEKLYEFDEAVNKLYEIYDNLLFDFECLVAYRDLMQFALCMEKDLPDNRKIITMAHENKIIDPILYISQKMILENSVKKLFKNTPTGYFKSYSDIIIISFINGYNLNADCLKVVGNPKMVTKTINGVSNMMLKPTYAKIFPFYQQYESAPEKMFKILAPRAGEMLLSHAEGIDFSLLCISKETPIDGGRYRYRFYDDITNSKHKTNVEMHDKDDASYNDQWKKRRYTEFGDCEWFTGTVYYYLDFLSRRRDENGFKISVPLKQFKYTKYCKEKKAVFVVIPKLDYETDECTFPQIYSTEQAKIDRENDFDTFQAMEQGLPVIPDGMPFDYSNMKVWKELPLKESEGGNRSDFTMAALDLPRTGENNLSLIIFSKCGELYYLVDAIYQKKKLDLKLGDGRTMLDIVCEKLVSRKVKHLVVENNVCANIKTQIEEKLSRLHYSCKIEDIYSSTNKQDKIFNAQSDIQQHIVLPSVGIFGLSSDVGKAVFEIVTWNTKAKSDDSIDTVAMFVNKYINSEKNNFAQAHSFKR